MRRLGVKQGLGFMVSVRKAFHPNDLPAKWFLGGLPHGHFRKPAYADQELGLINTQRLF